MKIAPRFNDIPRARRSFPPSGITRHSIVVHIEELVLRGFAPADRFRIASAVEQELERLMGEGGGPGWQQNPPLIERINGGAFALEAGAKRQAAGTEIARAVFRSLRQQARASVRAARVQPGLGVRRP